MRRVHRLDTTLSRPLFLIGHDHEVFLFCHGVKPIAGCDISQGTDIFQPLAVFCVHCLRGDTGKELGIHRTSTIYTFIHIVNTLGWLRYGIAVI